MDDTLRSEILGTAGLAVAAVAALCLTLSRRLAAGTGVGTGGAVTVLAILLTVQVLHAAEEYATGFHDRFPAVLGLAPWPDSFFLTFNLLCVVISVAAGIGLGARFQPAFFPAWFLAISGMANGVAHPLLALVARGYFPGLLTSPLVGVAGLLLWRELMTITQSGPPAQAGDTPACSSRPSSAR